jgi:hypothetical protein
VRADVVASRVGDTLVIVCLRRNRIFELNHTGSRIWELLSARRSAADIAAVLGDEYDVPMADAREEVSALTRRLRDADLIEVRGGG